MIIQVLEEKCCLCKIVLDIMFRECNFLCLFSEHTGRFLLRLLLHLHQLSKVIREGTLSLDILDTGYNIAFVVIATDRDRVYNAYRIFFRTQSPGFGTGKIWKGVKPESLIDHLGLMIVWGGFTWDCLLPERAKYYIWHALQWCFWDNEVELWIFIWSMDDCLVFGCFCLYAQVKPAIQYCHLNMGLAFKLSSLELLHLLKHRIGAGVGTWFDPTQKRYLLRPNEWRY